MGIAETVSKKNRIHKFDVFMEVFKPGDEDRQVLFIKEITRTCKKAFLITPNRYFPIEVHTRIPVLHFLPKRIFDRILKLLK